MKVTKAWTEHNSGDCCFNGELYWIILACQNFPLGYFRQKQQLVITSCLNSYVAKYMNEIFNMRVASEESESEHHVRPSP